MVIAIALILILITITITLYSYKKQQSGGAYDPYRNARPLNVLDFLRTFWLTG